MTAVRHLLAQLVPDVNDTMTTALQGTGARDQAPNGVIFVTNGELLTLVFSLLLVLFVSRQLQLDIERQLAVGALRCVIQLSALGLLLVPIITYNWAPLVLGYLFIMMIVAAVEAAARPPYVFDALVLVCFAAITTAVTIFATFTFYVVLRTGLDAQYVIPITGMITGSAMSAVSVAISNIVTEFAERRNNVEILLALGGNRWEASFDIIRSSIKLGLTPTLNVLSVTGLVSIPGMMTGQIIGGTPPSLAAKYQLVIMYINAGSATVATLAASLLTIYTLIDSEYKIRAELLSPRDQVNRVESFKKTVRYISSYMMHWRGAVQERRSPFPSYVNEPLPESQSMSALADVPPKGKDADPRYGATSTNQKGNEDM